MSQVQDALSRLIEHVQEPKWFLHLVEEIGLRHFFYDAAEPHFVLIRAPLILTLPSSLPHPLSPFRRASCPRSRSAAGPSPPSRSRADQTEGGSRGERPLGFQTGLGGGLGGRPPVHHGHDGGRRRQLPQALPPVPTCESRASN